jgi:hypothetical protein
MSDRDYEDVTKYGLDQANEAELLARQIECTFIWSNSEGHPLGVIMNYVFRDGRFWLTASSQRARVPAVRRDPRVSVVVTSRGSGIATSKSLTYKGRCVVHEDETIKAWFYPALAAPRLAPPGRAGSRARGPDRLRQHTDVAGHAGRCPAGLTKRPQFPRRWCGAGPPDRRPGKIAAWNV